MTPIIIRLLIFILAVVLFRWFLKQLQGGPSSKSSNPAGNMVKDPMCGMYMDPKLAVKHEMKNGIFYFCSEECREKFLQLPPGNEPGKSSTNS